MESDLATLVVGKTGQSRWLITAIVRSSAWYIHSEAILVTMLCSQEEEERRFAALKIIVIRLRNGGQEVADTSSRLRTLAYLTTKGTILKDLGPVRSVALTLRSPSQAYIAPLVPCKWH